VSDEHWDVVREPRDLEAEFRQLAHQLDVPTLPDYATRVRERLESDSTRPTGWRRHFGITRAPVRRLAAAAIILILATVVVLSVPATRAAVADLFGFAGVNVRTVPTAAPSPRPTVDAALDLGEPVTLDEANQQVSIPVALPRVPGLGEPDAIYIRNERGLESVSIVYRPTVGFPAAVDTEVGLLVSQYAGTATPYFDKLIEVGEPVTQVTVDGRWPGLYFTSPHQILVRGPDGVVHADQPRLAAPTLVWVRDGVTYRLEAAVDLNSALAVAASMQ
jgi:hypothetical protein